METTSLSTFIQKQITSGVSKEAIKEQLIAVGWSEEDVDGAYAEALVAVGVPVPEAGVRERHTRRASTLEIVLNFFSFILLGIVTTALGGLYFEIINTYFPDPLIDRHGVNGAGFSADTVHYAIAALIIGFPLYYVSVRLWFKKFRQDEGRVESRLTKWVTYLVLLAASVTIVGDLIALLFTFLQGELSARFFLKAITILVVSGMIFGFYYFERKKVQYHHEIPRKTFQLFGWALIGLVVVGVALGFAAAGSPTTERMRTFDERRASDLATLASCVSDYARQFERLPATLDELNRSTSYSYCASRRDPETGDAYEYRVVTPLEEISNTMFEGEFELCATFSLEGSAIAANTANYPTGTNSKWYEHAVGRACDTETVAVKQAAGTVSVSHPVTVPVP